MGGKKPFALAAEAVWIEAPRTEQPDSTGRELHCLTDIWPRRSVSLSEPSRSASAVFGFVDPGCERVDIVVVAERRDEQIAANDASNDEIPRRACPAALFWPPSTAMAQVTMPAAGHDVAVGGALGVYGLN